MRDAYDGEEAPTGRVAATALVEARLDLVIDRLTARDREALITLVRHWEAAHVEGRHALVWAARSLAQAPAQRDRAACEHVVQWLGRLLLLRREGA